MIGMTAPSTRPPIEIYGPPGLRNWIRTTLKLSHARVPIKYVVHELVLDKVTIFHLKDFDNFISCSHFLRFYILISSDICIVSIFLRFFFIILLIFLLYRKNGREETVSGTLLMKLTRTSYLGKTSCALKKMACGMCK